ncbi:hypothetical protein NMG60_11017153 [Bertholletia excelsa]
MLPFMAQGHLIPFIALARQILQTTSSCSCRFNITIASTPLNIDYIRSAVSRDSTLSSARSLGQIHLSSLPFCGTDHGLAPDTENTEALPLARIISLFQASTALEDPTRRLLSDIIAREGRPPLCMISDIFFGWATGVAQSFQTVNISFTTGGAYGTAAYVSLWQNLPHRSTDDEEFPLPGFPESYRFHRSQLHQFLRAANGNDPWSRFFQTQLSLSLGSFGCLCNTAQEIEPLGVEVLKKYMKLPIWTIGPLLPPGMLRRQSLSSSNSKAPLLLGGHSGRKSGIAPEKCLEWMDKHSPGSVLFISFGSQNTISAAQMMALAQGLEESGKPFIWVIRPPVGFDVKGQFKADWLPDGFENRIVVDKKQGLLVKGWAPQLEILSHKSTGAFLSHCGWNSVMEGLSQGVPIIGWPMAAEQGYNSKMLMEEMGVCVELTRGVQSNIGREEVKRVINLVLEGKGEGWKMKEKAEEIGELIKEALREENGQKGSSLHAMEDFISALLSDQKSLGAAPFETLGTY